MGSTKKTLKDGLIADQVETDPVQYSTPTGFEVALLLVTE